MIQKFVKMKYLRKWIMIVLSGFFVLGLLFRFIPYLIPIRMHEIEREPYHSVRFYDRNGVLLQEVLSENSSRSLHVPLDRISPYFLNAVIAAEDRNFFLHHGVDYTAVLRAALQNVTSGRIVSGASTITLQLARLLHPASRTFWTKISEAFTAFRLEAGMNKMEILEAYTNRLPMGGNLYGVESAARGYFGIPSSDLTLSQASFLAAIPNSPTRLNPYSNREEIRNRQRFILERMKKRKMIHRSRITGILKEDVLLKPREASFLAPHFVFHLMDSLPDYAQTVKTTIDMTFQKMVIEQIRKTLERLQPYHVTNAAAILLDNRTGEVLAYAGSRDFFDAEYGQVDGVTSLRQPGSALKPFLYLLALENGFQPASLITDMPTHYKMPEGIYSPKNYSETFHGPVRFREALANSLNVPSVRLLAKIGVKPFLERLHDYQINSLNQDADFYGVGLALGCGEVTLYELTRAYACLAQMGRLLPIREIIKVNKGFVEIPDREITISTIRNNYLITDILRDPHARAAEFGFHSVLNLPVPCAVKTGTSFRFCDNWTLGYTTDYTLGVWAGNFDHTPMMKVSGVTGAGPTFANIMHELYRKDKTPEDIPVPDGLTKLPVCPLSGKKPGPACPSVIQEWISKEYEPDYNRTICDMHVLNNGKFTTVLPAQFRTWTKNMDYEIKQTENTKDVFQITNPQNGAEYHRLSNLAPEFQSIRFQLNTNLTDQTIEWILNEKPVGITGNDHCFLWKAEPGAYILKAVSVEDGNLMSSVTFQVK